MSRAKRKHSAPNHRPAKPRGPSLWQRLKLSVYSATAGIALAMLLLLLVHQPFEIHARATSTLPDPTEPKINDAQPPGPAPDGMVWIPGGAFWMGADETQVPADRKEYFDARTMHLVHVDGFWMDKTEVTNRQFEEFVKATDYVTFAERKPTGPERAVEPEPFSFVFTPPEKAVEPRKEPISAWWQAVKGANWRHPEGPNSNLKGRENHPVVHIAYDDAVAYCQWANKRLPTEAEWEFAARGGLDRQRFCWGNELLPSGKSMANTWQGIFPNNNECKDGFAGVAPVASFPANGFGLHDMSGNVWEWCADFYHPQYYRFAPARNPKGPRVSLDPNEPGVVKRVHRGGSFLCADNFCMRYLPGARHMGEVSSAANHIGFRCLRAPAP